MQTLCMAFCVAFWQGPAKEPRCYGTMDTCARVQWGPAAPWGTGSWELSVLTPIPPLPAREQGSCGDPWQVQPCLQIVKQLHSDKAGWIQVRRSIYIPVMSRDSQTGPRTKGETKDGLGHWPASGPGSAGLQVAEVWQPAALLGQGLTAMGWTEMGLGWNGLLGHGQGERKPQRGWPGPW